MTNQEAFDRVWDWFVTRGMPRSVADGENMCRYRNGENQCAVGCLIPDDLYSASFEGNSISVLLGGDDLTIHVDVLDRGLLRNHFYGVEVQLLTRMQSVHDCFRDFPMATAFTEHMKRGLRDIAALFQLKVPEAT